MDSTAPEFAITTALAPEVCLRFETKVTQSWCAPTPHQNFPTGSRTRPIVGGCLPSRHLGSLAASTVPDAAPGDKIYSLKIARYPLKYWLTLSLK